MAIDRITHDKGRYAFDELVAGSASVHIERMSKDHIWMSVESDGRRIVLNFHSERGISVNLDEEPSSASAVPAGMCGKGIVMNLCCTKQSGHEGQCVWSSQEAKPF